NCTCLVARARSDSYQRKAISFKSTSQRLTLDAYQWLQRKQPVKLAGIEHHSIGSQANPNITKAIVNQWIAAHKDFQYTDFDAFSKTSKKLVSIVFS
ncbi:hypothetical protein BpHYR1_007012, partial [Brachionus plicatilis]